MDATLPTPPASGVIRSSLVALFPRSGPVPGIDELDLDGFLARLHRDTTWLVWWGLVASSLAFQLGTVWTLGRPWPAAWLGPRLADAHADACSRTRLYPLRQATFLLKTFGGMCWGADPQVRRAIGWSGH